MFGLTGGIGSGKSTIGRELRQRGFYVYDTDAEAKRLIVENQKIREQLIQLFGEEIYDGNRYCTDKVAQLVFHQPTLLQSLNQIVHPAVKEDILKISSNISEHCNSTEKTNCNPPQKDMFVESAILYESGFNTLCKQVVAVVAPEEVRLARAMQRDHADKNQILARMKAQITDEQLLMRADIIINNDGTTPIPTLVTQLLEQIYHS